MKSFQSSVNRFLPLKYYAEPLWCFLKLRKGVPRFTFCFLIQYFSCSSTYNHLPQGCNSDTFLLTAPACQNDILDRQHSTSTLAAVNNIPTFWSQARTYY